MPHKSIVYADDLNRATETALRHRFSCAAANGARLQQSSVTASEAQPQEANALSYRDIAIGSLLGRTHANQHQHALLQEACSTWLPLMPNVGYVGLVDCQSSGEDVQQSTTCAQMVHWRCYNGEARPGRTLWKKTYHLLRLLRHEIYPHRKVYLKVDVDALLLPRSLLAFLNFLYEASPLSNDAALARGLLYFGSSEQVNNQLYCTQPSCLFRSSAWRPLARAYNATIDVDSLPLDHRSSRRERRTPFASYAAGGVYGFSGAALDLIVEGRERPRASPPPPPSCLHEAAAAVQRYKASGHRIAHSAEDELIGLCMHLHRVPLVQCGCFYQYGPCDVNNWTTCRDGTPESRLCRLPLSVHKIRKVGWYRPWFSQLLAREPVHLAELLARPPPGPASQRAEPH